MKCLYLCMDENLIKAKACIELARRDLTKVLEDKTIDSVLRDNIHYAMFRLIQADRKL